MEKEYLERETLLRNAKKLQGNLFGAVLIISEIENMPAADVIEVVHCKDCKHYQEWDDGSLPTCRMWTDQWDMPTEPNGYCHYGELEV